MFKKIKTFKKTIKESKKKFWIYILGIVVLLNFIAAGYFIYSLLLLSGIEDIIRYAIMVFAVLMAFIFLNSWMNVTINNKKIKKAIFLILIIISLSAQSFVAYNIIKIYDPINAINKSTITYTTDMIVLKNSNIQNIKDIKKKKIGIINKEKAYEDNNISNLIIKENNLKDNNQIKEYSDYAEMLNDLYDKKIDVVLISTNYGVMFNSIEKFSNIKDDVKVIMSKSKEFKKKTTVSSGNKNIIKEPFTVLLMGVDSEQDGLSKDAAFNGDSLMLITFNPTTLNTTVLSIPRDTYVPIMCFKNNKQNKITHASWQGVDCMQRTIENFTDINIDYYVKMNFKGVVDLVNALGGVDVNVPMNFCEQNSDRAWGNSTICLNKGEHHLNGEQSLALARHRKTLALGDIQRGLNQQLVVEGMLKKLSTIDSLDKLNNILNTISKNMDTNISTNQILSFYNIGKDILLKSVHTTTEDLISMEKLYLDGYTKMIYDDSFKANLSNYVYYKSSLTAVVNAMKINLGLKNATMVKTFDFSINEVYEKEIIGKGKTDNISTITTLPNFIGKSKSYVSSWTSSRNIQVNFTNITKDNSLYKDSYNDGDIVSQSVSQGTEIDKIKTITFGVIVKENDSKKEETTESACTTGTKNTKCYLPNLIGKTKAEVDSWSTTLPVSVRIVPKNLTSNESSNESIVSTVSQSSGTLLVEGSTITITFKEKETTDPIQGEESTDKDSKPMDPNANIGNNTNPDSTNEIGG